MGPLPKSSFFQTTALSVHNSSPSLLHFTLLHFSHSTSISSMNGTQTDNDHQVTAIKTLDRVALSSSDSPPHSTINLQKFNFLISLTFKRWASRSVWIRQFY